MKKLSCISLKFAVTAVAVAVVAGLGVGLAGSAIADPPHGFKHDRGRGKDKHVGRGAPGGGPPPWAPAYGYRAKNAYKFKYHQRGQVRYATVADTVRLPTSGFGHCSREVVGGLLGAATGGFLGSKIGSGSGKTAAVIGGTILGALVGGNIGRAMDQVDQNCVGQVLERAPTGQPVTWQNPDAQGQYQVTPTRTYQQNDGRYCREYQTEVVIGSRVQQGYGTACRQPDGSWQKVS